MIPGFDLDDLCGLYSKRPKQILLEEVPSPPPRRAVHFSNRVRVFPVPSRIDLSKKERNALWHPEPKNQNGVLGKMMCGVTSDRVDGGEINLLASQSHGSDAEPSPISVVLQEQRQQQEEGLHNPESIAKRYHQCSAYSGVRAQLRALEDEVEIRDYATTFHRRGRQKQIYEFVHAAR